MNKTQKHFYRYAIIAIFTTLIFSAFSNKSFPIGNASVAQAATLGEENALSTATSYLNIMSFSKKGLIKQLKFEGFTAKEAKYGANKCGANWRQQAVAMAKSYLNTMAFSKSGLIKQLKYEGFTAKEAKYGANKCGANWKQQAAAMAKSYLNTMSLSKKRLIEQLEYEGFTSKQAKYGVKKAGL